MLADRGYLITEVRSVRSRPALGRQAARGVGLLPPHAAPEAMWPSSCCLVSSLPTHPCFVPRSAAQEERDASLDAFKEKFGAAGDVRRDDLTIMASKVVGAERSSCVRRALQGAAG